LENKEKQYNNHVASLKKIKDTEEKGGPTPSNIKTNFKTISDIEAERNFGKPREKRDPERDLTAEE